MEITVFNRKNKYRELENMTDEELYNIVSDRIKSSETAFSIIYDRHSAAIWTYCLSKIKDAEIAQDIFQETFINFYNSIDHSRLIDDLSYHIQEIACNLCEKYQRSKQVACVEFDESLFAISSSDKEDNNELLDLIRKAIAQLSPDYRNIIEMREYQNMSYQEIADKTGESLANVKVRIFRAKSKIRDILTDYINDLRKQKVSV